MRDKDSCPICGTRAFSWGRPVGNNKVAFMQNGIAVGFDVVVRHCDTCGNVQQFTKVPVPKGATKEKRKRGE